MPMKSKSNLSHTLVPGSLSYCTFSPLFSAVHTRPIILVERYVIGAAR